MQRKYQIIKKITEWPLSKVELVSVEGKNYILKTIHKDFADEIKQQEFLYNHLSKTKIPKIYDHWEEENNVLFLMEYIPDENREISDEQAIKIINSFHNETLDLNKECFSKYDYDAFSKDLEVAKKYTEEINLNYHKIESEVKKLFNQKTSIVHGDWDTKQILSYQDNIYMIDFGKSFYGPSILDFAYYSRKHPAAENIVCEIMKITPRELLIAKYVVGVMQISWLDLCKEKYIKYDYTKEIDAINQGFKRFFKELE